MNTDTSPAPTFYPATAAQVAHAGSSPGWWTRISASALKASAVAWFVVAALGQLIFVVYVLGFYGGAAVRGDFAAWNKVLTHGHIPGDSAGNAVVMAHLAFASVVILCGLLQLVPQVRKHAPLLHRASGRIYLVSVLVMSIGGLIMVWTRGAAGSLSQDISININAFLIIGCAVMAYRYARARRIDVHRRWALRLFMVVSGVWFFRVGLMFWIMLNQGPVGFDPDTFQGPAITTLGFGQFLLPLAVLELFFRAQQSRSPATRWAMASGLGVLTLATATGIVAASMILWLPRL